MSDLFAILDGAAHDAAPFVVVEVPGAPRGKGRPRGRIVQPRGGRPFIQFYTDDETRAYETAVSWRARAAMKGKRPVEGAVAVRIFAMMPVAKSWSQKDRDAALVGTKQPCGLPDCDNIAKSVLDAFNAIVFADDKQVVRVQVFKEYAEYPGLIVEVFVL